jgi:hypothetical protein
MQDYKKRALNKAAIFNSFVHQRLIFLATFFD